MRLLSLWQYCSPNGNSPMSRPLQTVVKAITLLETLAQEGPLGVMELSRRLGMHKSVVSRLLSTLKAHSFVRAKGENGPYDLGLRLFDLGQLLQDRMPFRKAIIPHVEALAAETGETASVGAIDQDWIDYLYDAVSDRAVRLGPRAGVRRPAWHDVVGRAILAYRPEQDVLQALRAAKAANGDGLPNPSALERDLRDVRANGYAVQLEDEGQVVSVAAPLGSCRGLVSAAMAVGGPASRLSPDRIARVGQQVAQRALKASIELGWTPLGTAPGDQLDGSANTASERPRVSPFAE